MAALRRGLRTRPSDRIAYRLAAAHRLAAVQFSPSTGRDQCMSNAASAGLSYGDACPFAMSGEAISLRPSQASRPASSPRMRNTLVPCGGPASRSHRSAEAEHGATSGGRTVARTPGGSRRSGWAGVAWRCLLQETAPAYSSNPLCLLSPRDTPQLTKFKLRTESHPN